MLRLFAFVALCFGLAGCMAPSSEEAEASLVNTRVVFPSPEPDGGPLIFEFYPNGAGLFALDEVADRGQSPIVWRVDDGELCIEIGQLADDCVPMALEGNRISLQNGSRTNWGTVTPL